MSEQETHRLYEGYRELRKEEKGKTTKIDYFRFFRTFDRDLLINVQKHHTAAEIQKRFLALGDEEFFTRDRRARAFMVEIRKFLLQESTRPTPKPTRETSDHPLFGIF